MDLEKEMVDAVESIVVENIERVESRRCGNDEYDGIEYTFYGNFIPVMPIINVIAETDGKAIAELHFANDAKEPHLGVFVADIPEQSHPAFCQ